MKGVVSYDRVSGTMLAVEPDGITELVRGSEERLLERVTPLVRRQSVLLNLARVERIDAGGIAALISLYRSARETGHHFGVVNPAPRVAEILVLVGLDRILVSRNVKEYASCELPTELTAA